MPVHDWTLVRASTYHHFHTTWMTHLCDALTAGRLPGGHYAMVEQHAGQMISDILTLHLGDGKTDGLSPGGVALADAPAEVSRRVAPTEQAMFRGQHGHRFQSRATIDMRRPRRPL